MRLPLRLAALSLALVAGASYAQDILFFEGHDFNGRRYGVSYSVSNMSDAGFNDRASSVVIRSGAWQLCTDAYFRGRCVTLEPGEYRNLGQMGLSNQVSSARQVGGGSWGGGSRGTVTLYEDYSLRGRSYSVNGPVENLGRTDFNDRARSMVVQSGTWELCADDRYRNCQTFGPGEVANLGYLAGQVSSLRPVGGSGGGGWGGSGDGGSGGGRPPPGWGDQARAVLYEHPGFGGRSFAMTDEVVDPFARSGFNDRAASLRVERGYWMFCSDSEFRGTCRTFGPGDYPSLGGGLERQISSGRRIHNDYPYRNNPDWANEYSQQ